MALADDKEVPHARKNALPATEVVRSNWTETQMIPSCGRLATGICGCGDIDRYSPGWTRGISYSTLHKDGEEAK